MMYTYYSDVGAAACLCRLCVRGAVFQSEVNQNTRSRWLQLMEEDVDTAWYCQNKVWCVPASLAVTG